MKAQIEAAEQLTMQAADMKNRGSHAIIEMGLQILQNLVNLLGIPSSLNFAVMGSVILIGVLVGTYSSVYVAKNIVLMIGLDRSGKKKSAAPKEFADIDA